MPTRTMCGQHPLNSASAILLIGHGVKMVGVNAVSDAAQMVDLQPFGYRADKILI